jgi:hypothetical protein
VEARKARDNSDAQPGQLAGCVDLAACGCSANVAVVIEVGAEVC